MVLEVVSVFVWHLVAVGMLPVVFEILVLHKFVRVYIYIYIYPMVGSNIDGDCAVSMDEVELLYHMYVSYRIFN